MLNSGPESGNTPDTAENDLAETVVPLKPKEQMLQSFSQEAVKMAEAVASGDVRKLADAAAELPGIESNGVLLSGQEIAAQIRTVADTVDSDPEAAYQALLTIPNGEFGLREKVANLTGIKSKYLERLRKDLSLE